MKNLYLKNKEDVKEIAEILLNANEILITDELEIIRVYKANKIFNQYLTKTVFVDKEKTHFSLKLIKFLEERKAIEKII